jgi:hypothetical protein
LIGTPRLLALTEAGHQQRRQIISKTIALAVAALLSLGALNAAVALPHPGDDTNLYENKSTGG